MPRSSKPHIFVLDDDQCILDTVSLHLRHGGFKCSCFTRASDCLKSLNSGGCNLLISDVKMPDGDGIEILKQVKRTAPWLPVVIMTSFGDVPLAVKAVKAGAFDFVEKPLEWDSFMAIVQSALVKYDFSDLLKGKPLTKTEKKVLSMILQGKTNKMMADVLHRSVRTIEDHRNHIMHKLDACNAVELVKRAAALGLVDTNSQQ